MHLILPYSSLIPFSHGKNIHRKKKHCNKIYFQPAIKVEAIPGFGKSHTSNTMLFVKSIHRRAEQGEVGIFPALSCQTKAHCSHHTGNETKVECGLNVVQCCCAEDKGNITAEGVDARKWQQSKCFTSRRLYTG